MSPTNPFEENGSSGPSVFTSDDEGDVSKTNKDQSSKGQEKESTDAKVFVI